MEFNQGSLFAEETNQQGGEIDFKAAPAAEKLFLHAERQIYILSNSLAHRQHYTLSGPIMLLPIEGWKLKIICRESSAGEKVRALKFPINLRPSCVLRAANLYLIMRYTQKKRENTMGPLAPAAALVTSLAHPRASARLLW